MIDNCCSRPDPIFASVTLARFFLRVALALVMASAPIGCARESGESGELPTTYGSGAGLETSVNGYNVLAGMFAKAGHAVSTRTALTPLLRDWADTIVFAPVSFAPPEPETVGWMEKWLQGKSGRTLIYIGRDFDAEPLYWRKAKLKAGTADQPEIARRSLAALARVKIERAVESGGKCAWFEIVKGMHRDVRKLEGPWLDNSGGPPPIDAAAIEIELNSRLIPADSADLDVLLAADDDMLLTRRSFTAPGVAGDVTSAPDSQLVMIANGSFLTNLPLVNREHRKLAGKLIELLGPKPGHVVFLASEEPAPPIRSSSADRSAASSMLDVFGVWPLSAILLQFVVLLAVFGFSRWPLFGPPRDPPPLPASDFGQHVSAVADSLATTGDASYAQERWQYYQDNVRGGRALSDATKRNSMLPGGRGRTEGKPG